MRVRRTGTMTLGILLIVFGAMFLLRGIVSSLTFTFILHFWPLVFIFLGLEILVAYLKNKEGKFQYDVGAIVLLIFLLLFAMFMGGMEWVIENIKGIDENHFYW